MDSIYAAFLEFLNKLCIFGISFYLNTVFILLNKKLALTFDSELDKRYNINYCPNNLKPFHNFNCIQEYNILFF